jgi:hypothetical protein
LQGVGQSLVRKYDSLFFELQLDDRFIGESEFWDAIVEHPALINGPLLASDAKAGLLHTDESIPGFFTAAPAGEQPAAKPKGLSPRALQILAGGDAAPAAPRPAPASVPAPVAEVKTLVRPVVEAAPAVAPVKKAEAAPVKESARPVLKAKSGKPKDVVKARPAAKVTKAPVKSAPKKPARKS